MREKWTVWFRGGPWNCKVLTYSAKDLPGPQINVPVIRKTDPVWTAKAQNPFDGLLKEVTYDRAHIDERLRLIIYRVQPEKQN